VSQYTGKVLNSLFLKTQAWMFSCFVPPLVRNYVIRTWLRTFHSRWFDYLELFELCLIL